MEELKVLLRYQEASMDIIRVESELASTAARQKYQKLHAQLLDFQKSKNALEKLIEEKVAILKGYEEDFVELETDLEFEQSVFDEMSKNIACTSDEMKECTKSLETLLSAIKTLKASIMSLADTLSKAEAKLKDVINKGAKAKKEYDAVVQQCDDERAAQAERLKELRSRLSECEKAVQPELLKKYKHIERTHPNPLCTVSDNKCGGCNMSLPTSTMLRVRAGDSIIECENCGRILYSVEED